jgi:hypothetical protein
MIVVELEVLWPVRKTLSLLRGRCTAFASLHLVIAVCAAPWEHAQVMSTLLRMLCAFEASSSIA